LLNLSTNAVIAGNAVYMAAAIDRLRIDGHPVQDADLTDALLEIGRRGRGIGGHGSPL
jgi:hypothetical protein